MFTGLDIQLDFAMYEDERETCDERTFFQVASIMRSADLVKISQSKRGGPIAS